MMESLRRFIAIQAPVSKLNEDVDHKNAAEKLKRAPAASNQTQTDKSLINVPENGPKRS